VSLHDRGGGRVAECHSSTVLQIRGPFREGTLMLGNLDVALCREWLRIAEAPLGVHKWSPPIGFPAATLVPFQPL
jgi:hypothetical protein